ncbi:hypothetical protein, partial [Streptomyces sp. SID3343]|uniref:hypothetical protein n=1 Tax=Streptomyces sp. SID3343 TaxID=2690260 RepID=UPI0023515FA4
MIVAEVVAEAEAEAVAVVVAVEGEPTSTLRPPGVIATRYPVIGLPPSAVGAVHDTTASRTPPRAVTAVGAAGTRESGAAGTTVSLG